MEEHQKIKKFGNTLSAEDYIEGVIGADAAVC